MMVVIELVGDRGDCGRGIHAPTGTWAESLTQHMIILYGRVFHALDLRY
jgi:hypothetical protein